MSDDNPYEDSQHVVWQDPTEYDMQKHGPPYLPTRLASDQKAEVRSWLRKQAAYYDAGPAMVPEGSPYTILSYLLAGLRGLYMFHQTAHWQTRGGHYYADHLLFQRIYEETAEGVDDLAERLIGLTGDPGQVSLCKQIEIIEAMIKIAHQGNPAPAPAPEDLVRLALNAETMLLGGISKIRASLEDAGAWTDGLDDLIPAIAGKHETFVYLLKQRAGAGASGGSYTYDRR